MINVLVFIFIWLDCKYVLASLSETEEKMTLALMEELQIHHRILIEEPSSDLLNLHGFKNFETWSMIVYYRNLKALLRFFVKATFPDAQTMIVLKIEKLSRIVEFLNDLMSEGKIHHMKKFTWLVLVDWRMSSKEDEENLLVPYDCEFFLVYPTGLKEYKLVEVYKVKNQIRMFDYGTWDKDSGLKTTEISWYWRRVDLKNLTMVMMGLKYHGEVGTCSTDRQCAHVEFIESLAVMMNFRIKWLKKDSMLDFYMSAKEMDLTDVHTTLTLLHSFRITGELDGFELTDPIFTNYINWYIKDPGTVKTSDFYLKPFETDIWISLIVIIVITSLTSIAFDYLSDKFTDNNGFLMINDDLFMPLECLCNQDGSEIRKESSFRVAIFAIRFLTLFIISAYLGTITSFSTVRITRAPFKNLQEFLKKEDYVLGADSYEIHKLFRYFQDPITRQIFAEKRFVTLPNETKYTIDFNTDSHKRVCTEKLSYVEYNDEAYAYNVPCKFYQIEEPIGAIGMSAVIPENSPFKEMINLNIIRFRATGLRHWTEKNKLRPHILKQSEITFDTVEFDQIIHLLRLLASGVLISIVTLILELVFKYFKHDHFCKKPNSQNENEHSKEELRNTMGLFAYSFPGRKNIFFTRQKNLKHLGK